MYRTFSSVDMDCLARLPLKYSILVGRQVPCETPDSIIMIIGLLRFENRLKLARLKELIM